MGAKPFKTRSTNANPMASQATANNGDKNNAKSASDSSPLTVVDSQVTLERRPKLSDKLLPDKNIPIELQDYDYVVCISVLRKGKSSLVKKFERATNVTKDHPMGIDRFFVNCRGWKVRVKPADSGFGYHSSTAAKLLCLDVTHPDLAKELMALEDDIESLRQGQPPDSLENIVLAGLNVDLIPSILYNSWEHARRILVAIRPSVDQDCAFAVLPSDVIYLILSFLQLNLSMALANFDRMDVYPPPWERRKLLSAFCGKVGRPMYLASAMNNVGVSELLHSIVERTLDTYGVVPNPAVTQASVVNPYCVRDFPAVVPPDDV